MNHVFYRLPIRFGPLMAGREMPTCSVGVSIAQGLHLLLHTRYGELRSDRSFGCRIWDLEFDRTISNTGWMEELCDSLEAAIRQHEPRLKAPRVTANLQKIDHQQEPLSEDFRRLATVTVQAILIETEEPFRFSTQLHLGQLSAR
jgi:phage baseplate assembly protein W